MSEVVVRIPKLGMSMQDGELIEWLVADGDTVQEGQVLYLLGTDKVEQEVESPVAGTVRLVAEPGATYEVGTELARIVSG
jgi:pyruvate/2-oxoglutarate dehydrogenase complex dihydrolipoamide acyltransferase (E2) component